ncbi:hypothetical protein L596_017652 [Steinernema carpocapsae]|uniref:Uncharacterized protein n=1 Tax=Steinernema carpocapsae TaxID=34508 RepID=A0A4U5N2M2_STECR|nr:hypothetical protein L596_017652 [Steinernema carpocapsae]
MVVPEERNEKAMKLFPAHEHVCNTTILYNYQPTHKHVQNSFKLEIQQDTDHSFISTFIEYENKERKECYGIQNDL